MDYNWLLTTIAQSSTILVCISSKFSELIKSNGFWTIVGTFIGAFLGFGINVCREKRRLKKLKRMIEEELASIKLQIPKKKKLVEEMSKKLKDFNQGIDKDIYDMLEIIFSSQSCRFIDIGYKNHIYELYEHLPKLQRNCLHFIYSELNIIDETFISFRNEYISLQNAPMSQKKIVLEYNKKFGEILKSLDNVNNHIEKYLSKNPPDIFRNENSNTISKVN